jgi:thiamine biosynthesis protein ThiS
MKYKFPLVIVKIDDEIVPSEEFGKRRIVDGSVVEVIHLTSGG